MKATGDIQVVPIGSGVSVRKEVQRAHQILVEADIGAQLHPNGTNVEGELHTIHPVRRRSSATLIVSPGGK